MGWGRESLVDSNVWVNGLEADFFGPDSGWTILVIKVRLLKK
jgi:hypothetical protein